MTTHGYYCAFEGIDGSGKTTLATRVAERLVAAGHVVAPLRPKGKYRDPVAESLRDTARDAHNLGMTSTAELLVYAAREAQLLAGSAMPALQRGEVVVADRSPSTLLALSAWGRGLDRVAVQNVADLVAAGRRPDLVVLVDVELVTSRLRKSAASAAEKESYSDPEDTGRKGLTGLGLRQRAIEAYREIAATDERWIVVDNNRVSIDEQVDYLAALIEERIRAAEQQDASVEDPPPPIPVSPAPRVPSGLPREEITSWFFDTIAREGEREPALACILLRSLRHERACALRQHLAGRAPQAALSGAAGIAGAASEELRNLLEPLYPATVAATLGGLHSPADDARRERLLERAPWAVLASFGSRDDETARSAWTRAGESWPALRARSLRHRDDDDAWELRDRLAATHAESVLRGLAWVDSDRAWKMRKKLGRGRDAWLLASVAGVFSELAWEVRDRVGRRAPKLLAAGLRASDDDRAWILRERFVRDAKEMLDSISSMRSERATRLRHAARDLWPSTVVSSIGAQLQDELAWELRWSQLERHPGDMLLVKHVVRALEVAELGDDRSEEEAGEAT